MPEAPVHFDIRSIHEFFDCVIPFPDYLHLAAELDVRFLSDYQQDDAPECWKRAICATLIAANLGTPLFIHGPDYIAYSRHDRTAVCFACELAAKDKLFEFYRNNWGDVRYFYRENYCVGRVRA